MPNSRVLWIVFLGAFVWAEPFVYSGSSAGVNTQVKKNKNAIYRLKQETARLREEIEGLRSIIEGLNSSISKLKHEKNRDNSSAVNEMANLLDKINQSYVSRDELRKALEETSSIVKNTKNKKNHKKTNPRKTSKGLEGASSTALYSKGVRLVNKKNYSEAKKRFDILAKRGYKKAATHFYLGEIAYHTAKYNTAIEEYKQSAQLDENAGYMDRLLLHTALAFEQIGDKEQAKRFFQAIVDGYPGTSSAKVAKKHL